MKKITCKFLPESGEWLVTVNGFMSIRCPGFEWARMEVWHNHRILEEVEIDLLIENHFKGSKVGQIQ